MILLLALLQEVDFVREVRPLLEKRCYACHDAKKQRGGLRLDRRADALKGGDAHAPAILPGKSAASPLFKAVAGLDPELVMPPKGPPLPAEEVAILRRWIDAGAPWPAETEELHWAFRPLKKPAGDIDSLIRAKLGALAPNPEADRRTLVRRLSFDLLGLPPSAVDLETDYETLVERYLASPRFGERWARHWLDVVRFAESHGFEMNQARPNAWPYRDYVIRAFNDDVPYDRFVREQLAGDALGVDAAAGFLVAGPSDQVKSPDIGLTLQQRMDELHDMVAVTGSAFLGLTVGCARCHTHKFDPIPQTDYYAMQAVFAGVQHGDRSLPSPKVETLRAALRQVDREIDDAAALPRPPVRIGRNVDRFAPVDARFVRFTIRATTQLEPCLDELEVFSGERNVARDATPSASSTLPGHEIHQLAHLIDGRYGNDWSWISNERGRGWVALEFPEALRIDRVLWSRDRTETPRYNDRLATDYLIEISLDGQAWTTVASSAERLPPGSKAAAGPPELLAKKRDVEKQLKDALAASAVYAGRFEQPGPTYRLHRGEPRQRRERVGPGALSAFGKLEIPLDAPERDRRLALADWIVRTPLAARVIVNRLWQQHLGTGIVDTPSDLGVNGGRPSHPELLDWLAAELVEKGWSLKAIHRAIVLSTTYRQSSAVRAEALKVDAGSRLLWRCPPRRLEAEALRDAILATSGVLNLKAGGPGFDLFEPNTSYVKVYTPRAAFGPEEFRRMIYQAKPRMQLDDVFGAFDCPDAGQIAPRRQSSITPLQALNLLNSPFLLQQAGRFADRAKDVEGAFRLALQRSPDDVERAAAERLVRDHGLAALCRALFNANEFVTVD